MRAKRAGESKRIAKARKAAKAVPLSSFALAQTRSRLKKVRAQIKRATDHPKNPDSAHDLRVAIRRFTQCLRLFRDLLDPGPARRMRKKLRKLMELCGAKRDFDVGLEVLREAGVPSDDPAFARFEEHRDHRMRELARALRRKHKWDSADRWPKQLALRKHPAGGIATGPPSIEWAWDATPEENVRRILPALAEEFFRDGEHTVANSRSLGAARDDRIMRSRGNVGNNEDLIHPFRLRGKRFRYTLEVFSSCYRNGLEAKLRELRGLQDRMGAINDCLVVLTLPGTTRRALAAVRKLLAVRDAAFRDHWRKTFSHGSQESWKHFLANPLATMTFSSAPLASAPVASTLLASAPLEPKPARRSLPGA